MDDEPFLRDGYKREMGPFLSASGIDAVIDCASSAEEALYRSNDADYALVLMDTEMQTEGMFGYEACSILKKRARPLVVIGTSGSGSYREDWIRAGADVFITKRDLAMQLKSLLIRYLQ